MSTDKSTSILPAYRRRACGIYVLLILLIFTGLAEGVVLRSAYGIEYITFWERTGGTQPTPFTFGVNSAQLTTRLNGVLTSANSDFAGWAGGSEFYDAFYSTSDGLFDIDGSFLTIEAIFLQTLPKGGGLNISEVGLNIAGVDFIGIDTPFTLSVVSFVAMGDNAIPGDVDNAVDGDLLTHTTMGNTIGQSDRLRLTLGISQVPEPSTFLLCLFGFGGLVCFRKYRDRQLKSM
jgi:hypothetical protein